MNFKTLFLNIAGTGDIADFPVSIVTSDSKKAVKNSVFVCIVGTRADGHDYAEAALASGAGAVVTARDMGLENQIMVDDTRMVYALLCASFFGYPAKRLKLVGVTGTNGKTSTTYILKQILEASGIKTGLIGTIQNMIGSKSLEAVHTTPGAYELQSLFRSMADEGCEYVVMEVSSHALDQGRVAGCRFQTAVFLNLTEEHLDYHGDMDSYAEAKEKLFSMCGTAVVNIDDPYAQRMIEHAVCDVKRFSVVSSADYTVSNVCEYPDGAEFLFSDSCLSARVRLRIPGLFSVYNSVAAGVAALSLGIPFSAVTDAMNGVTCVKGRVEVVPTGRDFTVIIDYAHTPDGLENVLGTLKNTTDGRLVALFGCGGDRDRQKRPVMGEIAARLADFVIVTSDNPRSENPSEIIREILVGMDSTATPYEVIENRAEAVKYAVKSALPGDVVLLAGKGHETYQILGDGTIHLDEREVVRDALNEAV